MKKHLPTVVAAVLLVVVLALYMVTFQVRFTEIALLKTFGEAAEEDVITEPGLYWKWPWPIQSIVKYDHRMRVFEDMLEQAYTSDRKIVLVSSYVGWRVHDPWKFNKRFPDEKDAQTHLRDLVRSHKLEVVGNYRLGEFVSTEPGQLKLGRIEQEILQLAKNTAEDDYGVKIKTVGLKELALPKDVSAKVFESMKKEREAKAETYLSEGKATKTAIVASANSAAERIRALAEQIRDNIIAEGREEEAKYLPTFKENQELRIFLDQRKVLLETLKERTTIVVDWRSMPWGLFRSEGQLEADKGREMPAGGGVSLGLQESGGVQR